MNKFRKAIVTPVLLFIICMAFNVHAQDSMNKEVWKTELQILLGFTGEDVDGIMGLETFNALKRFAYHHDLEDVVLRGEFGDIESWGFEQYLIKYHPYWIREIKNQRIFKDVHDKEYLRQADETLYTFEIAIQNAKLEVERLAQAKSRAKRIAQEKEESERWEIEKQEAERLTAELRRSIMIAEVEVDKWSLERLRAQRLASEKEQLEILSSRKAEATRLTYELEDIIASAKDEIDRLIEENKTMKILIEQTEHTETMAEELITKLSVTQNELKEAQNQIQDLSDRNDTLDIKLQDAKIEIKNMIKDVNRPWWKFWKKKELTNLDSSQQVDTKRWYHNFSLNINNNNLINIDSIAYEMVPPISFDIRYHLPMETSKRDIILEYASSFMNDSSKTQLYSMSVQQSFALKENLSISLKLGLVDFPDFEPGDYISFTPEIIYELPLKYKFISTSFFLAPQIMLTTNGGGYREDVITYINTGLRITID